MRYVVTAATPTYASGSLSSTFSHGDIVTVSDTAPDGDGDVWAEQVRNDDASYIRWSDLMPEAQAATGGLDERVIRAALLAAGLSPARVSMIISQARGAAS